MYKIIKEFTLWVAVVLVIAGSLLQDSSIILAADKNSPNGSIEQFKNKLDTSVPKLQKSYGVPGVSIGIIEKGEVKYILNYGFQDEKQKKPLSNSTLFQAASMSKSLTAWGIMKLVEEGKLSLNDPVEKYLTRWHLPESQFNKDKITIKSLLSHTAGLSVHGYLGIDPKKEVFSVEKSLSGNGFMNQPLKIINEPGSEVIYSGGGYTLLQLIIEEVTGMTFSQYMDKEILKPLGMENSSYSDDYDKSNMSKAYGYFGQELPNYNFTEKAAAGLKTTVSDFSKFVLANMNGYNAEVKGRNVLECKSVDLIHTPIKSDSGLGIFSKELSDGSTLLYHSGDNRGWHSVYGFITERKEGIVIFTNSDNGIDLRQDIYNLWLEYKTGVMPQQYYGMEKSRNFNKKIAIALKALLAIYILFFIVRLKQGRKIIITKKEKLFLLKSIIRILTPLILACVTYYTSYKMDVLHLQGGLKNIVGVIFVWLLTLFITGFFAKNKKKVKTKGYSVVD